MALIQLTSGMTEQEERTTQNTSNLYLDVVKLPKASVNPAALSPGQKVMTTDTGEVGIKSSGGDIIWYATLDSNGKIKQNPASVGQAGGIMALPATLPAVGKMLKMGTGGAPAEATFDDFSTGVQSGSSDSGYWVKFPDGTMICQMNTDISIWNTGSYGKYASLNFPQAFSSSPYFISTFPYLKGGIASYPNWQTNYPKISHEALSNAAVTIISSATDDFFVHVLAIGRWKA